MASAAHEQPHVPVDEDEIEELKERWRRRIRQARQQRSARSREADARALADVVTAIPQVAAARCVSAYVARPSEPGTGALLEALAARGTRVLLPVLGTGLARDWAAYAGPDDLQERAPGRPPEPSGPALGAAALADADAVLVPALAVDTDGTRLGQGGGWYDRALADARPGTPVIAVTYADEVHDAATEPLPRAGHDRPVDAVATPQGVRWLRTPAAG
jgi:5-formyltetrahydrofolate cyclo-ligase